MNLPKLVVHQAVKGHQCGVCGKGAATTYLVVSDPKGDDHTGSALCATCLVDIAYQAFERAIEESYPRLTCSACPNWSVCERAGLCANGWNP